MRRTVPCVEDTVFLRLPNCVSPLQHSVADGYALTMTATPRTTGRAVAGLVLVLLVLAAYWPILGHGFVGYDDEKYVTANRHVQTGFDTESLRWAWTSFHAANWHPLTWMSHMLDWQLFGAAPMGHHLTR